MAVQKSKKSSSRRNMRRSHDNLSGQAIAIEPTTGETHLYHRAHWSEGKLYYKGKVVMEKEAVT